MAQREIKFTTDGKKVIVIGSLNSQEKIVQEIFVIDGSEIPSGEHFVVKSLHDAPALSWKEKELKRVDEQYEKDKFHYDNELKVLRARFKTISNELRNKIEYAGKVLKNVSPESFKTLIDYLMGEIKYVVKIGYTPEIIEWKDFTQNYEDKLRLISFYGKDDGSLTYAIGQYYDFSGGNTYFQPFNNYEDAFAKFSEQIQNATIHEQVIETAKKHGIVLDAIKIEEWKQEQTKGYLRNIESYEKCISDYKSKLEKLSDL